MEQIKVSKTAQGWMADFVGNERIRKLFGTTVIPTPFTAKSSATKVLETIRMQNPLAEVTLA